MAVSRVLTDEDEAKEEEDPPAEDGMDELDQHEDDHWAATQAMDDDVYDSDKDDQRVARDLQKRIMELHEEKEELRVKLERHEAAAAAAPTAAARAISANRHRAVDVMSY